MLSKLNLFRKSQPLEQIIGAAIIDSLPQAVLVLDNDSRVSYLNPAAEKLYGINATDATGQPLEKISAPLAEALQEAATPDEVNVEYKVEEYDPVRYFEAHISPLVDQQGQKNGRVVVVSDTTKQKTLSMAHARSERFQILFDKSADAVVIIDPYAPDISWPIIDCNPAFCRMNGYDREELIGQSIDIVHEGPDSPENRANFFKRLQQEGTVEGTIIHRRKDGTTFHIQFVTTLFTFEGRELVLGIDRDITGRIRVEQALRESEEQHRSVTEQNLAGVYIIQDDKFRYVNPALANLLGYTYDEIVDRLGPQDLVHPDDLSIVMGSIRLRLKGRTNVDHYKFRAQRKTGEIIHCEVLGRLVTYQGRPAIIGTLLDITERIQGEEALIQHVGQLELINQVSREIAAELSLDILLPKAASLIQESFGYPHVGLFLLDYEREELAMKARAGSYAALFPADHRLKLDAGINGWVARNGERLLIGDVRADQRYYNPFPEQLILSELSVPVKWGNEVVGVLDIQSDQLDAFGKNDVLVLETLADQLATAIQNARLFEQVQQAIVELVEAEEAVRAERDRAQQYLDVAGAIIVALDSEQRVTLINRKGCEVLGYEPHEITGQNWFDTTIPEHERQRVERSFQLLMAGQIETVERVENAVVTRQREERIIEWQNALLRDDSGKITGTLSSGIDVTERRRAEEHEREQRILAEALRDNAAIINSTLDLDAVLERVLENVERVVSYDAAQILLVEKDVARITRTKGYDSYATEEELQNIALPVDSTLNLRRMVETQQPIMIPDISLDPDWVSSPTNIWARGYIGAPIILNDQIIGFLTLLNKQPNVYQQPDAERLQAFANQAAIAIRNAQLYEQINHYAAELETSNERLAAYGHTIAHDLKNPLSTLSMAFEIILAESDNFSAAGKKFAQQSQKLVQTMSRTIDSLLRLAELREDQGEIEQVDMDMVLEDVLAQLMKLIMDRGVRINVEPDLPDALGYTPWVQEVFANLISNAVKYIGQNNPDPTIMIRGSLQGDKVRYEVEDNGVGIAPEAQEKLFEVFTRFHKSEASGHGLGLSIVESIIHKLDGELGVESIPGQGSTFWVTLPAPPPSQDGIQLMQ